MFSNVGLIVHAPVYIIYYIYCDGNAIDDSCPRKATVVDVWGGDSLGSDGPRAPVAASNVYTASNVQSHETILLRMTPVAA